MADEQTRVEEMIAPSRAAEGRVVNDSDEIPPHIAREMEATGIARRDFLKVSGLAALGAVAASCAPDRQHVAPMVEKPEGVTPGMAYWYASTCEACSAGCGSLVKVRDGRPIKVEGNREHKASQGGLCAKAHGSVFNLYDADRLRAPSVEGESASWDELDNKVIAALKASGSGIRLLTGTVNGPAELAAIAAFTAKYPGARHVAYDAVSTRAIVDAHAATHGAAVTPRYLFDKASAVVSFGADFLGTWISPVEFARGWASKRHLIDDKQMSRHFQFEAAMTITGASADVRGRVADSGRGAAIAALGAHIQKLAGRSGPFGAPSDEAGDKLKQAAEALWNARGEALVVCGGNNLDQHKMVNAINDMLGAYGKTIDLINYSRQKMGNDADLENLLKEMESGAVKTLIVSGVNPAYDLPDAAKFSKALEKVGTKVAVGLYKDETASLCGILAPDNHALETWNDHQPIAGIYSLTQPTIRPLFKTRQRQVSLLKWAEAANAGQPYRKTIRETWKSAGLLTSVSWEYVVERGLFHRTKAPGSPAFRPASVDGALVTRASGKAEGEGFDVIAFEAISQGDGRHANNAWLQELPDPITKVAWDNVASVSLATAKELGVETGDLLSISGKIDGREVSLKLPAFAQPGQADGTVAIALGYGRTKAGRVADAQHDGVIGGNAFPLVAAKGAVARAKVSKAGGSYDLALSQTHDSEEERPIIKEATLASWLKDPQVGLVLVAGLPHPDHTLWPQWEYPGHRWGMVVNLNTCIGCAGCVVSCNAENNVPVVGKKEVQTRREMHWIRIDRYYSDPAKDGKKSIDEDPQVGFQPMMCQHCENAPCESVCPVAATSHSAEGLNAQAYNRCVGTRYCANNCPYKVRRFNWFDYPHEREEDKLLNLALNPEVTIRSRGVMEKCTMCVQRIADSKREAAKDGRKLEEHELTTACQQSCPTSAISFGDMNDEKGNLRKLQNNPRNYAVLAELQVKPAVTYLTKIRNADEIRTAKKDH